MTLSSSTTVQLRSCLSLWVYSTFFFPDRNISFVIWQPRCLVTLVMEKWEIFCREIKNAELNKKFQQEELFTFSHSIHSGQNKREGKCNSKFVNLNSEKFVSKNRVNNKRMRGVSFDNICFVFHILYYLFFSAFIFFFLRFKPEG